MRILQTGMLCYCCVDDYDDYVDVDVGAKSTSRLSRRHSSSSSSSSSSKKQRVYVPVYVPEKQKKKSTLIRFNFTRHSLSSFQQVSSFLVLFPQSCSPEFVLGCTPKGARLS